jgi:hypothetical protein
VAYVLLWDAIRGRIGSRGGAAVARRAHNPKVRGSNPFPATVARPPGLRFFLLGPIATGSHGCYVESVPYKDLEQRRSYGRYWIKLHPEKAREAMRRWRQRHPAEHAAEARSHYERHRERLAAYFAKYRREHRDVRQRADARRQARKRGAPGSHTTVEWIWLLQLWNWTCAYCGKRGPRFSRTIVSRWPAAARTR